MKTEKSHIERKKKIESAGRRSGTKNRPTSYDTSKNQTSTPQKVRESNEATAQQQRFEKAKGKPTPRTLKAH
jgi:hypothetical protein